MAEIVAPVEVESDSSQLSSHELHFMVREGFRSVTGNLIRSDDAKRLEAMKLLQAVRIVKKTMEPPTVEEALDLLHPDTVTKLQYVLIQGGLSADSGPTYALRNDSRDILNYGLAEEEY